MNHRHITRWSMMLIAILVVFNPWTATAERGAMMTERIERTLTSKRERLVEIRRDIHMHPELSGREERTAAVVADYLRALGIDVRTGVGGHGVVGILVGEKPGPVVAYRADMDAVATDAPDPAPFESRTPGARHICGHDVHTTVALGIADALSSVRDELPGTVKFIFQPAEENAEGARAMINDGVLDEPAPAAIFGVHCAPLAVGQIGSIEGMALPGLDLVTITITGDGDLESAATACAGVVTGTNAVSLEPSNAPAGGGDGGGFIAAVVFDYERDADRDRYVLSAGIRASDDDAHARAKRTIEEGLAAIDVPGVSVETEYADRVIPALVNDTGLVRGALTTLESVVGKDHVIVIDETTPFFSEDFAFYLQEIPGAMYFLGVSNAEEGVLGMPHDPMFAVDEDAITVGAASMSMVLLDYLRTH